MKLSIIALLVLVISCSATITGEQHPVYAPGVVRTCYQNYQYCIKEYENSNSTMSQKNWNQRCSDDFQLCWSE